MLEIFMTYHSFKQQHESLNIANPALMLLAQYEVHVASSFPVNIYMVPPAFTEVGQLVLQGVLQQFKHNTEDETQPVVT